MFAVNQLTGFGAGGASREKLIDVLDTTSLVLCVDIGDSASYASDGAQTLTDLSGTANMSAGSTTGADSLDPAFSGVIGAFTDQEFTIHDGTENSVASDIWRFTANPAWMETLHKDSAQFTLGVIFYLDDASDAQMAMGNCVNTAEIGFAFTLGTAFTRFQIRGTGAAVLSLDSLQSPPLQKWVLAVISIDEANGTGFYMMNGEIETFTSTYTSPSASSSSNLFSFGNEDYQHGVTAALSENARFAGAFAYQGRHLDAGELLSLHDRLEPRFKFSIG